MNYLISTLTSVLMLIGPIAAAEEPIDIIIPTATDPAKTETPDLVATQAYKEVARFMAIPVSHQFLPPPRAFRAIGQNNAICYLGGTASIMEYYTGVPLIASRPLSRLRWYLASPVGERPYSNIKELKGKTIGLMMGLDPARHIENHDHYRFVFASSTNLIKMLHSKRLNAAIINSAAGQDVFDELSITSDTVPFLEYDRTLNCRKDNPRSRIIIKAYEHAYALAVNRGIRSSPESITSPNFTTEVGLVEGGVNRGL